MGLEACALVELNEHLPHHGGQLGDDLLTVLLNTHCGTVAARVGIHAGYQLEEGEGGWEGGGGEGGREGGREEGGRKGEGRERGEGGHNTVDIIHVPSLRKRVGNISYECPCMCVCVCVCVCVYVCLWQQLLDEREEWSCDSLQRWTASARPQLVGVSRLPP